MREFFKGWRRKLGCATLVLACALLFAWMRSRYIEDSLVARSGDSILYNFQSDEFGLRLVRSNRKIRMAIPPIQWNSVPAGQRTRHPNALAKNNPVHKWSFGGVHWGSSDEDIRKGDFFVCVVSYWHLIAPLTLLSAFLLLWKPRHRTAKKTADPGEVLKHEAIQGTEK